MDDEEEALATGSWPLLQLAAAAEAAAATGSGCKDADAKGADVSVEQQLDPASSHPRTSPCANPVPPRVQIRLGHPSSELALAE